MTLQHETGTATAEDITFEVSTGTISGKRWTTATAAAGRAGTATDEPPVFCIPGLSQDERSYDTLARALASAGREVVALAPRGRGRSSVTGAGTYGWPAHARDLVDVAERVGTEQIDLVGWSFGAFVSMQLALNAPDLIRRLVLIDAIGKPEPTSIGPIIAGLERLGTIYATEGDYMHAVLSSGAMDGCHDAWADYLSRDLVATDGGFTTRTNKDAVLEDAAHGGTRDPYELWSALTMPVLVLRASKPILPGMGFIVTEADRDRFLKEVASSKVVEIDANHYCVGMLPAAAKAIEEFLND